MSDLGVGSGAVRQRCGVAGRQRDGAIEVLDRLLRVPEGEQQVAAVVVDRGVLGEELRGAIEVIDGEFGLAETRVSNGAVS